ncbi:hypothetical protein WA026_018655 [Henosepilachna vigintioctopunctata]|uniref:Chitin-binding type-2 domain-containing protein n=1 Tax=Henosepilachna vigintioctopunctata TaxID=420089 RepID=A0AAW1UAB3_9CUCU
MYRASAIFLIGFCAVSAVSALDPCDLVGQLKPDPNHCERFFQCTEDGWKSLQCQPKTRFNPKILVCDWAKNVKCPKKVYGGVELNLEPCDNVGDLKPDSEYCNRFYQCTNNGWASLQCQPPTLFNPEILRCDWERNVKCNQ